MQGLFATSWIYRVTVVAAFALMLAAGAAVAFFQIFSLFKEYDDEGYVMISVQSFLDGHRLYDEVYSQYGPSYYLYQGLFHQITGLPVTHDVVRVTTITVWLFTALLCSLFSFRVTGSLLLAAGVYLLTFIMLWTLTNEPGHPQEFCALLLAVSIYLASFASSAKRLHWVLPCLGALAAALLLTKVNAGLYLIIALTGACASFIGYETLPPWPHSLACRRWRFRHSAIWTELSHSGCLLPPSAHSSLL